MAKILYTSYYQDRSSERQSELESCIKMNINNKLIDKIVVLSEGEFEALKHEKIQVIQSIRPTYKIFFETINSHSNLCDISIISNTDIFFDETLSLLDKVDFNNRCIALSRYHYQKNDTIKLHNEKFSQDTWIFKGQVKSVAFCDFHLGKRGCDNRIAYELNKAGYNVINPAHSIRSIHYHLTDLHNYGIGFIPKPYLPIPLTHL